MESPMHTETGQISAAAMPLDIRAIKKLYTYSHLSEGNIRLLKLLPHRDITSPLQCSLIEYPLQDLFESNHHLYDSLSYAWGSPDKTRSISIGDCYLPITTNLHVALLRLRDRFFERIIWVDAICINQQDLNERSNQVRRMAMIYALANRVIVWLGEAEDDSDQALEGVHNSADGQPAGEDQKIQNAVLKLLQRPWFKRIWILQEVAAARHVLILCGSSEIDGYTFCMGINSLNLDYAEAPGLRNLIRSATYLIRRKVLQPKQTTSNPSTFSLNIAPLSELIDMYHAREASDCRDKVYALLGMSSDNYSPRDLSPNYDVQWETLFQQVIKLILCESLSISTWPDKEVAIIKSNCCTLGQVSSLKSDGTWSDKQNVTVSRYTSEGYQKHFENIFWTLTLKTLANSIQEGDIVCLLQGASKPTIIRPYKDYFIIIAIAISPAIDEQAGKANYSWEKVLQSVTDFPRDFLLVWDWTNSLSENGEDDKYLLSSQMFEGEKTTQLMEKGLLMLDLNYYERAAEFFKRIAITEDVLKLAAAAESRDTMAVLLDRFGDTIVITEDIVKAAATGSGDVIELLLDRRGNQITITEDIAKLAAEGDGRTMKVLLDQRGDQIVITEDIVKAAAGNTRRYEGEKPIKWLLNQRGDDITITEEIVKTAAGNRWNGVKIMEFLLSQRGDEITITEDIVKLAAGGYWTAMAVLLGQKGDQIVITEDIIKAAAENTVSNGTETMEYLLSRRGDEITITEGIVKAAAENPQNAGGIMELLLKQRGDEMTITEDVMKVAAANTLPSGKETMEYLLNQRGDEITITEGIVQAAAGNWRHGEQIIELLLKRRGNEITITEDIIKIAAANDEGVMKLLLNWRGE
ncbi:hypothetical protein MKX08_005357 [Trichoderma sp. CBMAI-0020]|nr:hypothetical protein MKX08_005357 [Trichoderma sp. CBMAI-0020]WOD45753.1 hypothetical protein [Trichoderma atroviride]